MELVIKSKVFNIPISSGTLFVKVFGSGLPVLVMHGGLGADYSTMLPLSLLASHYKVIFYDHRCNGRSSGNVTKELTWDNLINDPEVIRKYFGFDKWAVIGHSFGGFIALEYTIKYASSVSKLCLMNTGFDSKIVQINAIDELLLKGAGKLVINTAKKFFNGMITRNEFYRSILILGKYYYASKNLFFLFLQMVVSLKVVSNPQACIHGFLKLLPNWSVERTLRQIHCPTLICAGENDFLFPIYHQKKMAILIANSKLEIIKGAGHYAQMEKPKEIIEILNNFFQT